MFSSKREDLMDANIRFRNGNKTLINFYPPVYYGIDDYPVRAVIFEREGNLTKLQPITGTAIDNNAPIEYTQTMEEIVESWGYRLLNETQW